MPHRSPATPGLWIGPSCRRVRLPYAALQRIDFYSAAFFFHLYPFGVSCSSSVDKYFVRCRVFFKNLLEQICGNVCIVSDCVCIQYIAYHTCVCLFVSVEGKAGCEIGIDVSIWRQVFRVWLRAAAASLRLGLLPLPSWLHHWLWLLVVIGVWNLNILFHYSKFGWCWCREAHGQKQKVLGFVI